MKRILLYAIVTLLYYKSPGQFLTQSANGKSTIPLPLKGIGAALDAGKTEVAIGVNNYANVLSDKSKILIGGNLSAKSVDGLGSLFSSGDIVPQGDFLGFFGYSFSNSKTLKKKFKNSSLDLSITNMNSSLRALLDEYTDILREDIILSADAITDTSERRLTIDGLLQDLGNVTTAVELKSVVSDFKVVESTRKFAIVLQRAWQPHQKEYSKRASEILSNAPLEKLHVFNDYIDGLIPFRFTIFVQGGITARSFTRYLGLNITNLPNSFQDTLFRGGNIGIGINAQICNYWIGASYSYLKGDNFAAMKSKEYTLRTTDTTGNQALISEKKITGYAGKYGRVETNQLNVDLVGDFRINDTSRLIANLYLRSSLFSRDTSLLKNYTNVGIGLYFVGKKSSFLGGLYLELPDINNNLEKAKPLDTQNIRSPFKKLSFGIVTKFNISSIFNWSNRPAKPD